jgi:HAD superfamily hydrolase (TIGR01509 family)
MIHTIIFDIGNVLLELNPTYHFSLDPKAQSVYQIIPESVALLNKLSADYLIYAITDASPEVLNQEWSTFDFHQKFRDIVTSTEAKYPKSNPQLFKYFLEKHQLIAEECVFIDDRFDNIASAKKAHLNTILFSTPHSCQIELVKLGVLNNA